MAVQRWPVVTAHTDEMTDVKLCSLMSRCVTNQIANRNDVIQCAKRCSLNVNKTYIMESHLFVDLNRQKVS